MKLIEEIYDARYTHDILDLQKVPRPVPDVPPTCSVTLVFSQDDGANAEATSGRDSNIFPIFVIEHMSKRYGLQTLVDQNAWDLLYTVQFERTKHLEVEIFARFLQEVFDPDDLLFFMYMRSIIQKLLNVSFHKRWGSGEANRGSADRTPKQLWLSYRECKQVARTVFGNEDDAMYSDFMNVVESQLVGKKSQGSQPDSRRIEVTQLFHLAIVAYHETRPDEEGTEAVPTDFRHMIERLPTGRTMPVLR